MGAADRFAGGGRGDDDFCAGVMPLRRKFIGKSRLSNVSFSYLDDYGNRHFQPADRCVKSHSYAGSGRRHSSACVYRSRSCQDGFARGKIQRGSFNLRRTARTGKLRFCWRRLIFVAIQGSSFPSKSHTSSLKPDGWPNSPIGPAPGE